MNLKVFIGACVLSGLVACSSVKQDEAGLSRRCELELVIEGAFLKCPL